MKEVGDRTDLISKHNADGIMKTQESDAVGDTSGIGLIRKD
jgi:hypothetical protein